MVANGPIMTDVRSMILTPARGPAGFAAALTVGSMARRQRVGERLEHLGARLAALVDVLHPVLGHGLEGGVELLLVVGAEVDDLHALRLDLLGRGLLAFLKSLAALARGLLAGLHQRLAHVFGQRLEFVLADRIGEDRSPKVEAL